MTCPDHGTPLPCRWIPRSGVDVPPHRAYLVLDGKVAGVIRDIDGIEPSPQADGDPRELAP